MHRTVRPTTVSLARPRRPRPRFARRLRPCGRCVDGRVCVVSSSSPRSRRSSACRRRPAAAAATAGPWSSARWPARSCAAFDPPRDPRSVAGHLGVDFAAAPGTPVRAAGAGRRGVRRARRRTRSTSWSAPGRPAHLVLVPRLGRGRRRAGRAPRRGARHHGGTGPARGRAPLDGRACSSTRALFASLDWRVVHRRPDAGCFGRLRPQPPPARVHLAPRSTARRSGAARRCRASVSRPASARGGAGRTAGGRIGGAALAGARTVAAPRPRGPPRVRRAVCVPTRLGSAGGPPTTLHPARSPASGPLPAARRSEPTDDTRP